MSECVWPVVTTVRPSALNFDIIGVSWSRRKDAQIRRAMSRRVSIGENDGGNGIVADATISNSIRELVNGLGSVTT